MKEEIKITEKQAKDAYKKGCKEAEELLKDPDKIYEIYLWGEY